MLHVQSVYYIIRIYSRLFILRYANGCAYVHVVLIADALFSSSSYVIMSVNCLHCTLSMVHKIEGLIKSSVGLHSTDVIAKCTLTALHQDDNMQT